MPLPPLLKIFPLTPHSALHTSRTHHSRQSQGPSQATRLDAPSLTLPACACWSSRILSLSRSHRFQKPRRYSDTLRRADSQSNEPTDGAAARGGGAHDVLRGDSHPVRSRTPSGSQKCAGALFGRVRKAGATPASTPLSFTFFRGGGLGFRVWVKGSGFRV